jgi:hypothetical protein
MKEIKLASIGTDPEVFVSREGKIIPCIKLIKGTKDKPEKLGGGIAVLEDNVCLEWNVAPATSADGFVKTIEESIEVVSNHLPEGIEMVFKDWHEFEFNDISHPQAAEFGCVPDFNAYTMRHNDPPEADDGLRAAGAHIHLGFSRKIHIHEMVRLVRILDTTIGTYCVMNEGFSRRRELYGLAGSFRKKPYGLEYRTPSNFWIASQKEIKQIYNLCELAVTLFSGGFDVKESDFHEINMAINKGVVVTAEKIYRNALNAIPEKIIA